MANDATMTGVLSDATIAPSPTPPPHIHTHCPRSGLRQRELTPSSHTARRPPPAVQFFPPYAGFNQEENAIPCQGSWERVQVQGPSTRRRQRFVPRELGLGESAVLYVPPLRR